MRVIDRDYLEDRLDILDELINTHEARVAEREELRLYRDLQYAFDEGLLETDEEGGCYPCPSDL